MEDKTNVSDSRKDDGSLTKNSVTATRGGFNNNLTDKSVTATRGADDNLTKNSITGERPKTNAEKSEERIKKKKEEREAKRKAEAKRREDEKKERELQRKVTDKVKRDLESEKPLTASWSKNGGAGGTSAKYGVTMYSGHLPAAGAHVVMSAEKPRPFDTQRRPDGKLYAFRPTWIESCTGAVVDAKTTTGDGTGAWVVVNEGDFAIKTVTLSDPGKAPTVEYSVSSTRKKSEGLSFSVNVPLTKKEESGRLISLVAGSIMDPSPLYSWGYGDVCVDHNTNKETILKFDLGVYDAKGTFHSTCTPVEVNLGFGGGGSVDYTYGPVVSEEVPDSDCSSKTRQEYRQYVGRLYKDSNDGYVFDKDPTHYAVVEVCGGDSADYTFGPVVAETVADEESGSGATKKEYRQYLGQITRTDPGGGEFIFTPTEQFCVVDVPEGGPGGSEPTDLVEKEISFISDIGFSKTDGLIVRKKTVKVYVPADNESAAQGSLFKLVGHASLHNTCNVCS